MPLTIETEFARYLEILRKPKPFASPDVTPSPSSSATSSTDTSVAASPMSTAATPVKKPTRRFSYSQPVTIVAAAAKDEQKAKSAQPSPTMAPALSVRRLSSLTSTSAPNNDKAKKSALDEQVTAALFNNYFTTQKKQSPTSPHETDRPPSPNANCSEAIRSDDPEILFEDFELPPPAKSVIS